MFQAFHLSLTLLLTSFCHHVSVYLARPFAHPQLPPVASSKASFKTFKQTSTEASFWLLVLYLLMYDLKSFFIQSSFSFQNLSPRANVFLVSFTVPVWKSNSNGICFVKHSLLSKTFKSLKQLICFSTYKTITNLFFDGPDSNVTRWLAISLKMYSLLWCS